MMRAALLALAMTLGLAAPAISSSSATAEEPNVCNNSSNTEAEGDGSNFGIGVEEGSTCPPPPDPTGDPAPVGRPGTWHQENLCNEYACAGCQGGGPQVRIWFESLSGRVLYEWIGCLEDAPEIAQRLTVSMVANAFRRITLPASELIIQPPNGRTLVNFDTNFYTEPLTFDRTVRLLGHRVDLHITVHSYRWDFGDGEGLTSTEPGAPYPKLEITHNYLRKAVYWASLDTTYTADFRVDGGPWRLVPGTVTIDGEAERLQAIEARPTLVG